MIPAVTQAHAAPPADSVQAALDDPDVRSGLLDHAWAVLGRWLADRPAAVRAEAAAEAVQETQLRALQKRHEYDPAVAQVRMLTERKASQLRAARVLILAQGAVRWGPVAFRPASNRCSLRGHLPQPIRKVGETMPGSLPTQVEALQLHQRLLAADPIAPTELAELYLQPLIDRLAQTNPRAPADFREAAAGEALVALIKSPTSYDPGRKELFPYLCMSAQGDLLNLLKQESRHHQGRIGWKSVEHSPDARKYLGREDDPSLPLRIAEIQETPQDPAVAAVLASATPQERLVLELMLEGERRTPVIAAAIGLADRPTAEQEDEVKRLKDRIKARLRRGRTHT
jgi:DNA-directed RNA polymerase specialized sigma24 family protein